MAGAQIVRTLPVEYPASSRNVTAVFDGPTGLGTPKGSGAF
jgi:hypothetical protein